MSSISLPLCQFSDEQLVAICENANVVACECPARLVDLLQKVRKFRRYTFECIEQYPDDIEMHQWLDEQVQQIELRLSEVILEFMQKEDLMNEQNQLDLKKLAQRSYQAALRQLNDTE